MKRKAAVIGLGYLSGLLLASFFVPWLACAAGGILLSFGIIAVFIIRPDKKGRLFAFSAAALCCGASMLYYCGYEAFVYKNIIERSGTYFHGNAEIKEVRAYSNDRAFCTARITLPDGKKTDIGWYAQDSDIARGDSAVISGRLYLPENTGYFDSADYYRTRNVFLLIDIDTEEYYPHEKSIFHKLKGFRSNVKSIVRQYVPSDEGELLIGMLFGSDEWDMSRRTETALYHSGVGHIAAVSGMHMAVAAGIAAAAASALTLSKRGKLLLIAMTCLAFAFTADLGLSVMRALIMTLLVHSADLFRRHNDPLSSLCIAAFLLTSGAPFTVRSASFLLSFSGVFGASVLAPQITEAIRKALENRMGRKIGETVILSSVITAVSASLAVIPASALCLDELSVMAPVSNFLLSPFLTAAMMISMAGSVCALLPFSGPSGGLFLAAGAVCRPVLRAVVYIGSLTFASIPSGTKIAAPVIMLVLITALSSLLIMKDRSAVILTVSAAIFTGSVCISAYRAIPTEYTRISLLTEGNGGVMIISDGGYSAVIDLSGNSKSIKAAERYISRSDMGAVGFVALFGGGEYACRRYSEDFPYARVLSFGETDLTKLTEDNIIRFNGMTLRSYGDCFEAEVSGVKLLCVLRKCTPPEKNYDICIYDCIADVPVSAKIYAVTEKRNKCLIPADSQVYPRGGGFAAKNGTLMKEEERKWLR